MEKCVDYRDSNPTLCHMPVHVLRDALRTPTPEPHYPLTEPPRKRSNPGSLGLLAFAVITLITGLDNIIWPLSSRNTTAGVALIYGGLTQFIVGFMEHAAGNNFSGVTFATFGAMWLGKAICMFAATAPSLQLYAEYQDDAELRHQFAILDAAFALVGLTLTTMAAYVLKNSSKILTFTLGSVAIVGIIGTITNCIDIANVRSVLTRLNGAIMIVVALAAWYGAINELCLDEDVKLPVGPYARVHGDRKSPVAKFHHVTEIISKSRSTKNSNKEVKDMV